MTCLLRSHSFGAVPVASIKRRRNVLSSYQLSGSALDRPDYHVLIGRGLTVACLHLSQRLTVREIARAPPHSSFASAWRKLPLNVRNARRQHGPEGNPPIPNPLSTRFVATWPDDCSGWQIERHSAEGGGLPHVSAEEYFAGLPNPLPSPAMASFLACPGPLAAFELDCDGQRKAVGVKLVAHGINPVFVRQTLTASTLPQELDAAHPVFARQAGLVTYHWGTPGFLDLCEVLGLDPQAARPRFRPGWEELAEELLRWSCTVAHSAGGSWQSPQGEVRIAVSDLLSMMRVEARPTLRQLDALRERWEMMDRNGIPRFGELDALVHSDALLDPADPGAAGHRDPPLLGLDLLPSRYGPGCQTSIKGYRGPVPPAGWPDPDDAELRGIAIAPGGNTVWEQPWLRDAMQGLRGQGMVLLSPAET